MPVTTTAEPSLENNPIGGTYPMSAMQQAMLFSSLQAPASGVNLEQLLVKLQPDLDVDSLRAAVQQTTGAFSSLRCTFQWDPAPVAVFHSEVTACFEEHSLSGRSELSEAEAREAFLRRDRSRPFSFEQGPLSRWTLLTGGPHPELVWTFHHALLDGRSFAPVLNRLFACYEARRSGAEAPAVRADRLGEYLTWQSIQDHSSSREYWREAFAGLEKPDPIRAPLPREKRSGYASVERCWYGLGATCEEVARRLDVTTHTLVQGAWALLLSHYTGAEEVVFGSVRSCRHSGFAGAKDVVGLLINTVPFRVSVPVEATLADWLLALRERHLAIRPHEQTPLNLIQEWSRQPAGEPLFETLLAFENHELDEALRQKDAAWQERSTELHENTGFPLTLNVVASEHLRVKLSYDCSRFSEDFARGIARHFSTLVQAILTAEDAVPLHQITMLEAGERAHILGLNSATPKIPAYSSLTRWFEATAATFPTGTALTFEGEPLSYAGLNARSNSLARHLQSAGVGQGTMVAICLPRSLQTIIAMLGVLKTGAAYVPLEPSSPADRLAYILAETKAPVLLTESSVVGSLPTTNARVVCLDREWLGYENDVGILNIAPETDAPAYVIYTSGSTGKPKGVVVSHFNVLRLLASTEYWYGFDHQDVWSFFHSFSFDVSVFEIWGALLYGGRLVIVPYLTTRAPDAFHELLVKERVTVLSQTPSAFRQLIAIDETRALGLLSLRYIIFAGEALEHGMLRGWFARHGDQKPRLVNMYGITETTVHSSYRVVRAEDAQDERSLIGCAIPDLSFYVRDRFGEPCPIGVPGELFVGGAGVAIGYLNLPELTAQRFGHDPFSADPEARLYRSGDLARYLPDGDLEYLGRIDQQVKIRGFRVELGEIESTLRTHGGIREAVVLARRDGAETRLAAYLLASGERPAADELRTHLRRTLPEYMVPATFTYVERWPLTANGKLDRVRLPVPVESVAPAVALRALSTTERAIASAWCAVLGRAEVEPDRNFFDSGGDSLRLLQVWARLKAGLAPDLPMVALFTHPTVEGLARHLSEGTPRAESSPSTAAARQQAQRRNLQALRHRRTL